MDKNPTGWTEKRLKVALADMVKSYNNTKNSKTGLTPASCNFPEFDPILREINCGVLEEKPMLTYLKEMKLSSLDEREYKP